MADALEKALTVLWNGRNGKWPSSDKTEYICHAVFRTSGYHQDKVAQLVIQEVMYRLRSYTDVEEWLSGEGYNKCDRDMSLIQAYRKRWVLSMIKELRSS
jgi:hypothetical protein